MAKTKGASGSAVANRPAYSRVSFLYQAAALLAGTRATPRSSKQNLQAKDRAENGSQNKSTEVSTSATKASATAVATEAAAPLQGMSRRLLTQMRAVSRKTNMRLRPAVKHRVCKYCDTLLVEGTTCVSVVENHSRGGRKPWADMLTMTCQTCGRARRFPVSAPRQPRRPFRDAAKEASEDRDNGKDTTLQPNEQQKSSRKSLATHCKSAQLMGREEQHALG